MRIIIPFALLFASATAVQAQEPVRDLPADPAPVVAPTLSQQAPIDLDAPIVPALQAETNADNAASSTASVNAETKSADAPAAMQDTPRNWWWTVGAIVLAGVILAVLL